MQSVHGCRRLCSGPASRIARATESKNSTTYLYWTKRDSGIDEFAGSYEFTADPRHQVSTNAEASGNEAPLAQDLPARYIGPLGAGRPPAGSSVTAKTSTVATPGSGRTERLPVPVGPRLNTPAEHGRLGPRDRPELIRLPRGRRGQPRGDQEPPPLACQIIWPARRPARARGRRARPPGSPGRAGPGSPAAGLAPPPGAARVAASASSRFSYIAETDQPTAMAASPAAMAPLSTIGPLARRAPGRGRAASWTLAGAAAIRSMRAALTPAGAPRRRGGQLRSVPLELLERGSSPPGPPPRSSPSKRARSSPSSPPSA